MIPVHADYLHSKVVFWSVIYFLVWGSGPTLKLLCAFIFKEHIQMNSNITLTLGCESCVLSMSPHDKWFHITLVRMGLHKHRASPFYFWQAAEFNRSELGGGGSDLTWLSVPFPPSLGSLSGGTTSISSWRCMVMGPAREWRSWHLHNTTLYSVCYFFYLFDHTILQLIYCKNFQFESKLTHQFARPVDLPVYERVVEEKSTEDEDSAVKVLQFWLINDGSQD